MAKKKTVKRRKAKRKSTLKGNVASPASVPEEGEEEPLAAVEKTAEPDVDEIKDLDSLQKIFDDASRNEDSGWGLRTTDVECPYCGEEFEISVDPSEENQEMIQDCQVCCHPITFSVEILDGELTVEAYRD